MKRVLIILLVLIVSISGILWSMRLDVSPGGGMVSISLSAGNVVKAQELTLTDQEIKDAALDKYEGTKLTELSDTQYKIDYPGTKSSIEIGSVDKNATEFKADITIKHWDDEVGFSLIAPATIDSKSELSADLITDKVIASNGEWNFEYFSTQPNDFNEYGGIDIIITAKEKPISNKIYFTYDSTTVTPYYQGELTPEEIEEGASRPDHVIGSIAFYADGKANHAIGDVNYATGKVGHLYAMRAGEEWCRWSIEGEYIVLTIPDAVFNGKYPVIISPVGDTFGYTSIASTTLESDSDNILGNVVTGAAGTANSISWYVVFGSYDDGPIEFALYKQSDQSLIGYTTSVSPPINNDWNQAGFSGGDPTVEAIDYIICHWGEEYSIKYDSLSADYYFRINYNYPGSWPTPAGLTTYGVKRTFSAYCTYTPSGGTPDISVSPTDYDFGVVAASTEPYTATDYFTVTNNSTMQTDQTIAVTAATWTGGNAFTHSDTATPGADTVGMKANRGGTWGSGDVIVKYDTPNYIYENCPATTGYSFGIKLYSPTSASDGAEKTNTVRVSAVAD